MKKCSKCGKEKYLTEFYKDKSSKNGLYGYCKECSNEISNKWNDDNKDRRKEYNKINKEYKNEYNKKWNKNTYQNIKEKIIENSRKYRARKLNAGGVFSEEEFKQKLIFYQYKCCKCGTNLKEAIIHRDHMKPLSKGGSNYISNIQPLCAQCNLSKNSKHRDYRDHWLQNYAI